MYDMLSARVNRLIGKTDLLKKHLKRPFLSEKKSASLGGPRGQTVDTRTGHPDLEFVKKFTRPNFPVKEFYTLKTRKSRLFSPTINSKNTSLSVIWPSFG